MVSGPTASQPATRQRGMVKYHGALLLPSQPKLKVEGIPHDWETSQWVLPLGSPFQSLSLQPETLGDSEGSNYSNTALRDIDNVYLQTHVLQRGT